MRLKHYIILIACTLCAVLGTAQSAWLTLTESEGDVLRVDFGTDWASSFDVDDDWFIINIGGACTDCDSAGRPSLPRLSRIVALPVGSRAVVESVTAEEHVIDSLLSTLRRPLRPIAEARSKNALPAEPVTDKAVYSGGLYRPGAPVEVQDLGVLMGRQVLRITVNPFAYDGLTGQLRYCSHIAATLKLTGGTDDSRYAGLAPERYLIVSRPEFREGLQPFVEWKRQEGYDVVELYSDSHRRDSVKQLIQPLFDDATPLSPAPTYILLVGDAAQLQAWPGTTHPTGVDDHITDLYYAEYTGDYLPDAILGRWPVNDTAELRAVVQKTLRYARGEGLVAARLQRLILVAGQESRLPAPTTTNGQVNYLRQRFARWMPGLDTICYHNPSSGNQRPQVLSSLRQGAALLNYTAHCNRGGWQLPYLTFSHVDTVTNPQPLLYVNNCCLANDFTGTCFGEQLLRKPSGGAIGAIGATNETLWNEDYYWAVGQHYPLDINPTYDSLHPGAFDRMIQGDGMYATQGGLVLGGNLAVSAAGSPYDKFYWEIYCLFGDPSLRPYIGQPQQARLTVADTVVAGTTELTITGTAGATVSAVQEGQLLATMRLDGHGSRTLTLRRPAQEGSLILTATGAGLLPATDSIAVVQPQGRAVNFRDIALCDTAIDLSVVNIGTLPIDSLWVAWHDAALDSTCATTADQAMAVANLAAGSTTRMHVPVAVRSYGPMWDGMLTAFDSTGTAMLSVRLRRWIGDGKPTAALHLVEADGSAARRIVPQHDYAALFTLDGPADTASLTLTQLPTLTVALGDTGRTAFRTADTLSHLHLVGRWRRGNERGGFDYWMVGGDRIESFENGFADYPWQHGGTKPWVVDRSRQHGGHYSARSGAIDYRQTSDLAIPLLLPDDDSISFWAATSSEDNYDLLTFSIDDSVYASLSGLTGWQRFSFPLAAGRHLLRWRYIKDESNNSGQDCAWIDDLQMPLALWDTACGYFGPVTPGTGLAVVDANPAQPTISLTPNPSRGKALLRADVDMDIAVYTLTGIAIDRIQLKAGTPYSYATRTLPQGTYLLRGRHSAGVTVQKMIILE